MFEPGELAVWHSGSTMMSWPPDGQFFKSPEQVFEMLCPEVNTITLVIARNDSRSAVVLTQDRLWWCPISSLKGELSSALKVKY